MMLMAVLKMVAVVVVSLLSIAGAMLVAAIVGAERREYLGRGFQADLIRRPCMCPSSPLGDPCDGVRGLVTVHRVGCPEHPSPQGIS